MILIALSQDKKCIYQSQQYFYDAEKEKIKNNMFSSLSYLDEYDLIEMTEYEFEKLIAIQQIDICPEPTDKERITKLEEEKSILAENVYQLASILEIMLGGTEDGQTETTSTDTAN